MFTIAIQYSSFLTLPVNFCPTNIIPFPVMVNIPAKFDRDAHSGSVSSMFTKSKCDGPKH